MSTLQLLERHLSPFDILFRNHFHADSTFQPASNTKQSHPLNIFFNDDVILDIEGDILKISYKKPEDEKFHEGTIHQGLSKKSFDLRYKIAPKFDLSKTDAVLENGLLEIFIPLAEEAKPKSIKIK